MEKCVFHFFSGSSLVSFNRSGLASLHTCTVLHFCFLFVLNSTLCLLQMLKSFKTFLKYSLLLQKSICISEIEISYQFIAILLLKFLCPNFAHQGHVSPLDQNWSIGKFHGGQSVRLSLYYIVENYTVKQNSLFQLFFFFFFLQNFNYEYMTLYL